MKANLPGLVAGAVAGIALAAPLLLNKFRRSETGAMPAPRPAVSTIADKSAGTRDRVEEVWTLMEETGSGNAGQKALDACGQLDRAECAAAADRAVKQHSGPEILRALLARWATLDHKGALGWMMRHGGIKDFKLIADETIAVVAATDPAGLESWYASQGDMPELTADVIAALLPVDAAAAIRIALKGGQDIELRILARGIRDSGSAERAMLQLRQASESPHAIRWVERCRQLWIQLDPVACARWEAGSHTSEMSPKEARERRESFVGAILGAYEPAHTATAVFSAINNADRNETMELLVDRWTAIDPDAAGAWLNRQPDTPDRWPAAAAFAAACAPLDAHAAMTWAGTIGDAALRQRAEKNVVLKWYGNDPVAVEAWLSASNWTPETRQEMRERLAVIPRERP